MSDLAVCCRVSFDTYGPEFGRYGGAVLVDVADRLDRLARTGELGKPGTWLGLLTRTPESRRRAPLAGVTA